MKLPNTFRSKRLHGVLFSAVMLSYTLGGINAHAKEIDRLSLPMTMLPTEVRVLTGTGEFSDLRMAAFAYRIPLSRRFGIDRFELASGVISDDHKGRLFASLGPVWQLPIGDGRTFAEFSFSPTIIGGSTFGDRDLGGNFHFTSSLAFGTTMGAQDNFAVSLRAQHTSNGRIRNDNPGLDLFGLNFSYQFGQ